MPEFTTFYLDFVTPLHIGDPRPDEYGRSEVFLRSDTLVAAVYATWARIGRKDWIPADGSPPFTVSSAFPYVQAASSKFHFFPRPLTPLPLASETDISGKSKAIKKIKWLEKNVFEEVLVKDPLDEALLVKGRNFLTHQNIDQLYITQTQERVQVPRDPIDADARPFYMERVYFPRGGLFFMAKGQHLERLHVALEFLQDEGFGTDRNVGNGHFKLETGTIDLQLPENSTHYITLGLCCPKNENELGLFLDPTSRYQLIRRGGWITAPEFSTYQKCSVYMFSEGSVYPDNDTEPGNPALNLKPSVLAETGHPIWRCGKSISLPINI